MSQSNKNRPFIWERTRVGEIGYIGKGQCAISVTPRYLCPMNCLG